MISADRPIGSPHGDGSHGPLEHFIERDENVPSHVLTAEGLLRLLGTVHSIGIERRCAARSSGASAKELFKKITETRALELEIIFITARLLAERIGLRPGRAAGAIRRLFSSWRPTGRTSCGFRMAQDLIGLVDFLEFLLRRLLVLGDIGMILPRQRAESLLDFLVRRLGRHTQDPVIVFEFSGHGGLALCVSVH